MEHGQGDRSADGGLSRKKTEESDPDGGAECNPAGGRCPLDCSKGRGGRKSSPGETGGSRQNCSGQGGAGGRGATQRGSSGYGCQRGAGSRGSRSGQGA